VLAVVTEVLAHRAAGVGREELHRGGIGGRRGDDDRVVHRAVLLQLLDDLRDRRLLLADRDVDADDVLALLVDDRVDGDAVLPVWRSPMISSRWPRPIGTIASMALMPVCIGSCTDLRSRCRAP
jgi:hypothetical protein